MGDPRERRVFELFQEALDVAEGERLDFVRRAAGEDRALFEEVRDLLRADAGFGEEDAAIARDPSIGQRVGPYTIREEIGRGGMGSVYLATREDVGARVALKLAGGGRLASRRQLERFLFERRLLARLEHPNIARLLDAGVTPEGLPYFAMELVRGRPITEHCDRERLSVRERLALFRDVCAAVHYAHRKLVLHRDLKPSNVLVDDAGRVKLLDFGIGKLLGDDESETPAPTRTGMRLMTPEYASPEQFRGEPVTTSSDVYSLGALLYELLTGRRPHELSGRSISAMERVIAEQAPKRPSSRPAEGGTIDARRLRRQLAGDLDNIVMTALRKEPDRRYASAEQLAEEIDRHLTHRPVSARPDSVSYRAGKFLRRNLTASAVATLVLALIVGFGIRQRALRAEAERARDEARTQAARAARVSSFLVDVFEVSDPSRSLGREVTAREVIDRGAARIGELDDQPEVQGMMMAVLGRVFTNLGLYGSARPLLEAAYARRRGTFGERHAEVAETLADLARLAYREGDYAGAEREAGRAVELWRELGADDLREADALDQLAAAESRLQRHARAEVHRREALALRRALLEPGDPAITASLEGLATGMLFSGRSEEAVPLLEEALAARRVLHEGAHPDTASTLDWLGAAHGNLGELERADARYREALEMRRSIFGDEHPEVAATINKLGVLSKREGDLAAAEALYREALAMRKRLLGPEHPDVAVSLSNLAGVLELRDDPGAETLYREALAIERRVFGDDHHHVSYDAIRLGLVLLRRERLDEAERLFDEALAIEKRISEGRSYESAMALAGLGRVRLRRNDPASAEPLLRRALEGLREAGAGEDRIAEVAADLEACRRGEEKPPPP